MRNHRAPSLIAVSLVATFVAARSASAQPADDEQPVDPWAGDAQPAPDDSDAAPPDEPAPPGEEDAATPSAPAADQAVDPDAARPGPIIEPRTDEGPPPSPEKRPIELPVMFNAATAELLPAGVILSSAGVDTGGGISSDLRVGLGDVAEFGVGSTDLIRVRSCEAPDVNCQLDGVRWYPLALFKMGLSENRLFRYQPALALGFRKSFERHHDARKTRVAELYLVASKSLGSSAKLHVGGVFWDASIQHGDLEELFHTKGIREQLRPFGGIELEPLPRSKLLLELVWVPEFELGVDGAPDDIELRPMFAWGVRYELNDWAMIESGVRIPDIGDINLLDAQIFGQLKFVSRRFSRFLDGLD